MLPPIKCYLPEISCFCKIELFLEFVKISKKNFSAESNLLNTKVIPYVLIFITEYRLIDLALIFIFVVLLKFPTNFVTWFVPVSWFAPNFDVYISIAVRLFHHNELITVGIVSFQDWISFNEYDRIGLANLS